MKTLLHILSFEWKILWRSGILKMLLLVMLVVGLYGIYFGKLEIDKQKANIAQVQKYEQQQFDSLLTWVNLDTSFIELKEKYLQAVSPEGIYGNTHFTYYISKKTPAGAGLCLGQRDLHPVYYGVDPTDLARQMNTRELANPMKLMTGNFDLSYVFVFLFPLLIITLFYNLYSGEKEKGTLPLLKSHSTSLRMILFSKGILRLLIVLGLTFILLTLGFIIHEIHIETNRQLFFHWLLITGGYCCMWAVFMIGIASLSFQSSINAMLGLGLWIIFTFVIPPLVNLVTLASAPLPNRAEVIHEVRNLNDKIWENPKTFVWKKFMSEYPQYSDTDTTDFTKWQYAGCTLLDKKANFLNAELEEQIVERNAILKKWSWLSPASIAHEKLSGLSNTDRKNHIEFITKVHAYHKQFRDIYYAKIFSNEKFSQQDLKTLRQNLRKLWD